MAEFLERIGEKVRTLSDLELAVLLCLVSDRHCIIQTEEDLLDAVENELHIIATEVYGLTCSVLECSEETTLDDFGNGILVENEEYEHLDDRIKLDHEDGRASLDSTWLSNRRSSKLPKSFSSYDSKRIANVVIARNLNTASPDVQVQALELIRGKRNFTRTAVHAAPKPFLLIALNQLGTPRLTIHLNDHFFISHKHYAEDGLPNLDEAVKKQPVPEDDASTSSVIRSSPYSFAKTKNTAPLFSLEDIDRLAKLSAEVKITSEVRAYIHNIVVFMRLHRAVEGGVSAMATRHFTTLCHALAPLHGLSYITPALVALAARKVYPHRINITSPERERSMQWGSSLEGVKAVLQGVTPEDVIEEVLQSVEPPL